MENRNSHILTILQHSFLFRGLKTEDLKQLAEKSRISSYRPGQILIEEDIYNSKILLILKGLVKIYKTTPEGKEIFISVEKTGNYLGVMDLEEQPGASATIETLTPTEVLILSKKDLIEMLKKHSLLWERMHKIINNKMKELNQLYSIRLGNNLYQRTYLLLQFLSNSSNSDSIILSQETLANIVGATRPRVTETLRDLKKAKKISVSSKRITLLE